MHFEGAKGQGAKKTFSASHAPPSESDADSSPPLSSDDDENDDGCNDCKMYRLCARNKLRKFLSLLKEDPTLDISNTHCGSITLLMESIRRMNDDFVRELLRLKADPSVEAYLNGKHVSPLKMAIRRGSPDIVSLLLEAGADVEGRNPKERTPFVHSFSLGAKPLITRLLAGAKANLDAGDPMAKHQSALMQACSINSLRMTKMFLDLGASVNHSPPKSGSTPLIQCIVNFEEGDHLSLYSTLVKANVDVNVVMETGMTALKHAIVLNSTRWVKTLLKAGADVNAWDGDKEDRGWAHPLWHACEKDSPSLVRMLLENGAQLNDSCVMFRTMHMCLVKERLECMSELLKAKADINVREGERNGTLLHLYATGTLSRCADVVAKRVIETTISLGSDVHALDKAGKQPLTIACQLNVGFIVPILIKHKANVNHQQENGSTALMHASEAGYDAIVQCLLDANADVRTRNALGADAAMFAVGSGHAGCVDLLYKTQKLAYSASTRRFHLVRAIQCGHASVLASLIKNDADPNAVDPADGKSPLFHAVWDGHKACVETLLRNGANPDPPSPWHMPYTVMTIERSECKNREAILLSLILGKADANAVALNHRLYPDASVLWHASVRLGNCRIVDKLLKAKADPTAVHSEKRSVLEDTFDPECRRLLEQAVRRVKSEEENRRLAEERKEAERKRREAEEAERKRREAEEAERKRRAAHEEAEERKRRAEKRASLETVKKLNACKKAAVDKLLHERCKRVEKEQRDEEREKREKCQKHKKRVVAVAVAPPVVAPPPLPVVAPPRPVVAPLPPPLAPPLPPVAPSKQDRKQQRRRLCAACGLVLTTHARAFLARSRAARARAQGPATIIQAFARGRRARNERARLASQKFAQDMETALRLSREEYVAPEPVPDPLPPNPPPSTPPSSTSSSSIPPKKWTRLCMHGSRCSFYKKGKCRYFHPVETQEAQVEKEEEKETRKKETKKKEKKEKSTPPRECYECPICFEASSDKVALVPCGHVMCASCARTVKSTCFTCSAKVQATMRLFE